MSWVCDVCSCNNDDENMECFVCGSHRSEASIREAKRRKLEKKLDDISDLLYTKVFLWIKILSIIVGSSFLIGCIIKIAQGKIIYDVSNNFNNICANIGKSIDIFLNNINDIQIIGLMQIRCSHLSAFISELDFPILANGVLEEAITNISGNSKIVINNIVQFVNWENKAQGLVAFHFGDRIQLHIEYLGLYFSQVNIPVSFTRFIDQTWVMTEKSGVKSVDTFSHMLPGKEHFNIFSGLFKNSHSNAEKIGTILSNIISSCGASFRYFVSVITQMIANVGASFDKFITAITYIFSKSKRN